ncbi:MAG: 4-hydroxy-3-methylbut-2-enyl diphosphate reductase, partial [Clostridia bacterium]|nr:4-hydroxy-3-methylbut-2-enyl diphosphate reductase [Clostridia bacterium]
MRVVLAKHAGFCGGVKSAVDKALKLAGEHGKIYTIGELVHNELVSENLQSNGVFCINPDNLDELKAGDVALIRAHGIEKEKEQELRARGVVLFDATCPVVKRNQHLAEERANLGEAVIIVGDKNHDEVIGVKSYAGDNSIVVADDEVDKLLDDIENGKSTLNLQNGAAILFQTTILAEKYQKIEQNIQFFEKKSGKTFGIFNTICYTTKERQDETRALAGVSDAVIVLGSESSANTRRLVQVAKEVNPRTYFVHNEEEAKQLLPQIKDIQCVSIAAGASTPPWLIREVTKYMSETQNKAKETEVKVEATLQEANNEPQTMEELMKSTPNAGFVNYKPGKRVAGKVIFADENGIHVAIGGKKDGFIDKEEASLDGNYNPADYKPGDEVQAIILSVDKDHVTLSKKQIDEVVAQEEEAEKALAAGEFSLTMTEVVKGGLRGKLGKYTVFVPASQIRIGYVSNLEDYKGKTLRLTLMPQKEKAEAEGENAEAQEDKPQKRSRYLFASQRIILEREKKEKEDLFWDNIHVHDIVTGKVKRFTAFGAFVSVRGFDCLAHISELSWNKITDPAKVLKIGESYDFVVLKMDRETGKISLGYKQLQKKPYEVAADKFPVGTVI